MEMDVLVVKERATSHAASGIIGSTFRCRLNGKELLSGKGDTIIHCAVVMAISLSIIYKVVV